MTDQTVHVRSVLAVGGDLIAKSRLQEAADRVRIPISFCMPTEVRTRLMETAPSLVVVDLDEVGKEQLHRLGLAQAEGLFSGHLVGFYSHVDAELAEAARQIGCKAVPRGRFWRTVDEILSDV